MSSNKRRKLDNNGKVTGSPAPAPLSAFAARQQLFGTAASRASSAHAASNIATPEAAVERETGSETPSSRPPAARRRSKRQPPGEPAPSASAESVKSTKPEGSSSEESDNGSSGAPAPDAEPSGRLVRQHSTFRPGKNNPQRKPGGRLVLSTREAERLVVVGSFGIEVREGEATIAGAILTPADGIQWVHAPLCHAVPVIRTTEETVLELRPHPTAEGLRQLGNLNPVFARIWDESPREDEAGSGSSRAFQIIYTSDDVPKKAVLQELVSPAEWNKKLAALVAARRGANAVIFMCGPKSSGKSTFGRLLVNRLMTDRSGSKNKPWSTVMFLDLDPGQPEYSPPGVVSLSKLTAPNLSPSFCHPSLSPAQGLLRAHAIASVTPALDPAHFTECALDLFSRYQRGPGAKCPLVINTPGWIQGTGLDLLTGLITSIQPTEVIYMSQDGPEETVSALRSACNGAAARPIPFSTLPSQPAEGSSSSRTPLHLRTMQSMSYFHLRPSPSPTEPLLSAWDPTPLAEVRPWRVRYAGRDRGFLGVICYDHQLALDLLADAINGTVMALVRLESRAALRGLRPVDDDDGSGGDEDGDDDNGMEVDGGVDVDNRVPDSDTPASPAPANNHQTLDKPSTDPRPRPNTTTVPANFNPIYPRPQNNQKLSPAKEQNQDPAPIPLIPNPLGRTLSPAHSHLISLVLVRAVDTARGELQLLMPPPSLLPSFLSDGTANDGGGEGGGGVGRGGRGGLELVLVAGRFDAPGWAYCEGLYAASAAAAAAGSSGGPKGQGQGQVQGQGQGHQLRSRHGGGRAVVGDEDGIEDHDEDDGTEDVEDGNEDGLLALGEDDAAVGRGESVVPVAMTVVAHHRKQQHQEVPWVEMLHGSQKRTVGSKVWRVRRDLGRN